MIQLHLKIRPLADELMIKKGTFADDSFYNEFTKRWKHFQLHIILAVCLWQQERRTATIIFKSYEKSCKKETGKWISTNYDKQKLVHLRWFTVKPTNNELNHLVTVSMHNPMTHLSFNFVENTIRTFGNFEGIRKHFVTWGKTQQLIDFPSPK